MQPNLRSDSIEKKRIVIVKQTRNTGGQAVNAIIGAFDRCTTHLTRSFSNTSHPHPLFFPTWHRPPSLSLPNPLTRLLLPLS